MWGGRAEYMQAARSHPTNGLGWLAGARVGGFQIHKLNSAAKRKSSERLHSFLQETRMFAVSTHTTKAAANANGRARTWKLIARKANGDEAYVQLDATMVCHELLCLVTKCANTWFYSMIRWRRERHDHCMQVTTLNLRVFARKPTPCI